MPQQKSQLESYVNNYGSRLQSLLAPPTAASVTDTSQVGVTSALQQPQGGPPQPQPLQQPRMQQPTPDQQAMAQPDPATQKPKGNGLTVRKAFGDLPDADQEKQAKDLQDALKRGGTNVDEAYDEMIKQMGTRPDDNLSNKEKSMLLIEFGLNLMANSSGKAYGQDLSGALGASGLNSMDSYQRASGARQRQWDAKRSALEESRGITKAGMAQQATKSELESDAKLPKEFAPTRSNQDTFPGGDGYMYQLIDGKASRMKDENGEPIKATKKELDFAPGGRGATEKTFEFDHRRKSFLQDRGYDDKGEPLSDDVPKLEGPQKRKLLQQATSFAGDTKNASLSDEEVMQQAQRAVDEEMRYHADLYRNMTPSELEAERSRLVKGRVSEIKGGRTPSALDDPKPAAPPKPGLPPFLNNPLGSALSPNAGKAPPAEALAAGKARKIKGFDGKWTLGPDGKPKQVS
jgi:hypothetical protein